MIKSGDNNHLTSKPFTELRDLSHDEAYQSADINDVISIETIAATLRDGEDLIKYLYQFWIETHFINGFQSPSNGKP